MGGQRGPAPYTGRGVAYLAYVGMAYIVFAWMCDAETVVVLPRPFFPSVLSVPLW